MNNIQSSTHLYSNSRWFLLIAGFILVCVLAPLSISVGLIPVTLQTFALFTVTAILGKKEGTLIALIYLLAGALGAPVFSGFSSGWEKFIGPTAGFLWAFPICCYVLGELIERQPKNMYRVILSFIMVHFILLITGFGYMLLFVDDYSFTLSAIKPLLPGLMIKSFAGGIISSWVLKYWFIKAGK